MDGVACAEGVIVRRNESLVGRVGGLIYCMALRSGRR